MVGTLIIALRGLSLKWAGTCMVVHSLGLEPMKTVWLVPKEWSLTCAAQRVRIKHPNLCRIYLIKASEPAAVRAGGKYLRKTKKGSCAPLFFSGSIKVREYWSHRRSSGCSPACYVYPMAHHSRSLHCSKPSHRSPRTSPSGPEPGKAGSQFRT